MKAWRFAIICTLSIGMWSGCLDEGPEEEASENVGVDGRNIGVRVVNDIESRVKIVYWALRDTSPEPNSLAYGETYTLNAGEEIILPVAFGQEEGFVAPELWFWEVERGVQGTILVNADNPKVRISEVQNWRHGIFGSPPVPPVPD